MLDDYRQLIDDLVRDKDCVINTDDRDNALARAVARYSVDRPQTKIADVAGAGTRRLAVPTDWQQKFSAVQAAEHPIGNIPADYLSLSEIELYVEPDGTELIQLPSSIPATDQVRISFTVEHVVDGQDDTTPNRHQLAIASLAAALLCDQLASNYSTESAPTLQADTVNHGEKPSRFRAQARAFRKAYFDEVGVSEKRSGAAGVVVDLDRNDSHGNDRLFHQRRYR